MVNESSEITSWFTILFIKMVSEKFNNVTKDIESRIFFFSMNKLNQIIKVHKNPLPNTLRNNVVYKL